MRRYCASVGAVLLLAGLCWGQSVELPKEITGEPGTFVRVGAKTDGKEVRWLALDGGLSVFPSDLLRDSKTTVVVAQKAGRYRLAAWSAKGDVPGDAAITVVVIGTPGPDPGPGPGPLPDDPLTKALQAAYDKESDADKAVLRGKLAALYRQGAGLADNADVTTWGQLFDVLKAAAGTLGVAGKLPAFQAAVAEELRAKLPADRGKALDAAGRTLAADTFRKVAVAAEGVK